MSTPVSQHPDFLRHQAFINSDFSFLTEELGFAQSLNDWVSWEFTSKWEKANIEISIIYCPGAESTVAIYNKDLPYYKGREGYNMHLIGPCNGDTAKALRDKILKMLVQ